jgi:hypothetical protein
MAEPSNASRIRPCLYGVFVNGLVIDCADPAPTIVIDEIHRRFPPCPFPEDAPLQNGGHNVVPVPKNVRFNGQILTNDPLYRIIPAVEQRLQVLDDNRWKLPSHSPSNQPRFRRRERANRIV